jgi:hypothetical protein
MAAGAAGDQPRGSNVNDFRICNPLELVSSGQERRYFGVSSKIKVINSVWNGTGMIKRKVADFYVAEGRAVFVGEGQLRLIESHPKNQAAAARAAAWQQECVPDATTTKFSHAAACFPGGLRATEHVGLRFVHVERRPSSALLRFSKDGEPQPPRPMFPYGEPRELLGKSLPHQTAKPQRPALMRQNVMTADGKKTKQWHAYGTE